MSISDKKLNFTYEVLLADAPVVLIAPQMRCGYRERGEGAAWCGRLAVSFRPGEWWELPTFRCGRHAAATDLPLPTELAFRRVRLMAQVDFAGVVFRREQAQTEAIARLELAVADAGGLLSNVSPTSAIVRWRGEGAAAGPSGDGGGE